MKTTFSRRIYSRPAEFFHDMIFLIKHRKDVRTLLRGSIVNPSFRERLMLLVTSINKCRYCNFVHTLLAKGTGISSAEIMMLRRGGFKSGLIDEEPALRYALQWAKMNARPDAAAHDNLLDRYGLEKTAVIDITLRIIRMGNLTGNTADYLLHRISGGRWGAGDWGNMEL